MALSDRDPDRVSPEESAPGPELRSMCRSAGQSGSRACSRSNRIESRVAVRTKECRLTMSTCMSSSGSFSAVEFCVLSREPDAVAAAVSAWASAV